MTRPWSLKIKNISFGLLSEIVSLGGSTLLVSLSNLIIRSGLLITVGRILGTQSAGVYGVVLTLISHIYPLISSLSTPLTTIASEWQARNNLNSLQNTCNLIMRTIFSLSISMAAGLYIYGEPFLRIFLHSGKWSASDFHAAGRMLFIMGVGVAIGLPQVVSTRTLQGIGKHWQVGYYSLGMSFSSTLIGVLIMYSFLGIYGAAIGWSLFWILQGILFYPGCYARYSIIQF